MLSNVILANSYQKPIAVMWAVQYKDQGKQADVAFFFSSAQKNGQQIDV